MHDSGYELLPVFTSMALTTGKYFTLQERKLEEFLLGKQLTYNIIDDDSGHRIIPSSKF